MLKEINEMNGRKTMRTPGFTANASLGGTQPFGSTQTFQEISIKLQPAQLRMLQKPLQTVGVDYCQVYQDCLADSSFEKCHWYANYCLGIVPGLF
jgi:hypothetical protein